MLDGRSNTNGAPADDVPRAAGAGSSPNQSCQAAGVSAAGAYAEYDDEIPF